LPLDHGHTLNIRGIGDFPGKARQPEQVALQVADGHLERRDVEVLAVRGDGFLDADDRQACREDPRLVRKIALRQVRRGEFEVGLADDLLAPAAHGLEMRPVAVEKVAVAVLDETEVLRLIEQGQQHAAFERAQVHGEVAAVDFDHGGSGWARSINRPKQRANGKSTTHTCCKPGFAMPAAPASTAHA
jgi:hypothetical protein